MQVGLGWLVDFIFDKFNEAATCLQEDSPRERHPDGYQR